MTAEIGRRIDYSVTKTDVKFNMGYLNSLTVVERCTVPDFDLISVQTSPVEGSKFVTLHGT
jgi:hypothetical protein